MSRLQHRTTPRITGPATGPNYRLINHRHHGANHIRMCHGSPRCNYATRRFPGLSCVAMPPITMQPSFDVQHTWPPTRIRATVAPYLAISQSTRQLAVKVIGTVCVAREWQTESPTRTHSAQLLATTGPGTRKGRRLSASALHRTPRSWDFDTEAERGQGHLTQQVSQDGRGWRNECPAARRVSSDISMSLVARP